MSTASGTALVTGATSGIGEVYAQRLADRGYDLVLTGRNAEKLASLAVDIAGRTGRQVERIVADLSSRAELARVEERLATDKAISLVVNSAGLIGGGPLGAGDIGTTTEMLDVNVTALTRLTDAAAKAFTAARRGGIINIASVMAFVDTGPAAAYAASKAYVLHLALALAPDLAPHGVRVQAVMPGYTRTAMIAGRTDIDARLIMDTGAMVDAALAGYDAGETVTIPSMRDIALFEGWLAARAAMRPQISLATPAERLTHGATAAA